MAKTHATGGIILPHQDAPATPPTGSLALYAKDGGALFVKDDTGSEREVGGSGGGGGPSWPVGSVIQHAGTVAPTGWMMCIQGVLPDMTGLLLKDEYPELYDAIGLAYTPAMIQTMLPDYFGLPHMEGAVAVGAGSSMVPGNSGGSSTVSLDVANMPSHTHSNGTLTAAAGGNHNHGGNTGYATPSVIQGFGGSTAGFTTGFSANGASQANQNQHRHTIGNSGTHTHDVTGNTSAAGSGSAFSIMQPYVVLNYIIRVVP